MKLLDCTLRDGGYYTNWDFDKDLVKTYCKSMESLPIDYVEVGYRSIPLEGYLGEYFYCPDFVMKELKEMMPSKKLVIILNEKDIRVSHVSELLKPCKEYISMVRIAIDPANFKRAIELAKAVKVMGFEVAFNVMYMSEWKKDNLFLNLLNGLDDTIDYFYMVDSFGGVFQEDVEEIIDLVKSKTNINLGFHGHNNLEMALANTITAMSKGCEIVDATITGMGRGAGNLKTELLLTYLNSKGYEGITFGDLSSTVALFEDMKRDYGWGTNLPYMFSGAYSLPQKQVMEWMKLKLKENKKFFNNMSSLGEVKKIFQDFLSEYEEQNKFEGLPSLVEVIYRYIYVQSWSSEHVIALEGATRNDWKEVLFELIPYDNRFHDMNTSQVVTQMLKQSMKPELNSKIKQMIIDVYKEKGQESEFHQRYMDYLILRLKD